ncbi:gp11 domain protein [Gordonia sp. NB41Y]|uniref:LGFP repeat-containing protein n=1 Tax=Gordonia sp. NB41Y TaxID=875808 RepID=UPI0002BF60E0|nr:gp11 domain protein [Gordonia sp. NB41Y]EMP10052.1 hypothetical protein ISGA_382 [Gordonia sp. NB41Y]WLP90264.1 hypothetical protein Q9K23_22565 [Gordonia sp. NB41Y]
MTITITPARAQEVHDRARARNGLYYGYGEAFTTNPRQSTDCSGLVLQTGAWYGGRTDWSGNRYGSTESFRLDYAVVYNIGFKRLGSSLSAARAKLATLGFAPVMLVGLQHGGGGIYSHTACTLMTMDRPGGPVVQSARGVDWESQGNGVFLYDGARAWNDGLFHDYWYFDGRLQAAPVINEIDAEAKRAAAWIGARKTGELDTVAPGGKYADFVGGRVYWHPLVRAGKAAGDRAVAVPNHILEAYNKVGSSAGPLGLPTERHTVIKGVGDIQAFERGVIYRKYGADGVVVHGAILDRFAADKFEAGWGWPLTGEAPTAEGGRMQEFEKRTATWHPSGVVTSDRKDVQ